MRCGRAGPRDRRGGCGKLGAMQDAPKTEDRLERQLDFILEIDRLKSVLRQTPLADGSRLENSAEHSWHLALMAVLLAEYADAPVDLLRVIKMILVHDLVEIDAGDTYCYDEQACRDKARRERAAADRIFRLLPAGQREEIRLLWEEFERRLTPEARFANALDRLQPALLNFQTRGRAWRSHGVKLEQVQRRMAPIADASTRLWAHVRTMLEEAADRGYLGR